MKRMFPRRPLSNIYKGFKKMGPEQIFKRFMDNSDIIHQDLLKQSQNESSMKPSMKPSLKKPKAGADIMSDDTPMPLRDDLSGSGSENEKEAIRVNNLVDPSI